MTNLQLYFLGWKGMWYVLAIFVALVVITYLAEGGWTSLKRCFWWFKHKIIHIQGYGFRCCRCGKSKYQINGGSK